MRHIGQEDTRQSRTRRHRRNRQEAALQGQHSQEGYARDAECRQPLLQTHANRALLLLASPKETWRTCI